MAGFSGAMTLVSVFGNYGREKRTAEFNQEIGERNEALAAISMDQARRQGADQLVALDIAEGRAIGTQRAALAAQGQSLDTGAGAPLLQDTELAFAQDRNTVRNNTALAVWGYENQVDEMQLRSGLIGAQSQDRQFATIVGGAADFANNLNDLGVFDRDPVVPTLGGSTGSQSFAPDPLDFGGDPPDFGNVS